MTNWPAPYIVLDGAAEAYRPIGHLSAIDGPQVSAPGAEQGPAIRDGV